jgi:hypothetical protein
VQLDADANEQTAILLHYLQTLAANLIGPHGGPDTLALGFQTAFDTKNRHNNTLSDLTIGSGRYYVDGVLCENDAFDEQGAPLAISYYAQGDYPFGKQFDPLPDFPFLLYLDVWEHHVTALEAPRIHDGARGFAGGQWVELTGDALELRGELGTLVRLVKVEDELLTIDPLTASGALNPNVRFPDATTIVRRWDQREVGDITLQGGAIPVNEGVWIDLEDGISVQFQPGAAGDQAIYRTGDYWLIPARTATGDVEWPRDDKQDPKPLPPHGVEHHYAPLATITTDDQPIDLRHRFVPSAKCAP